MVCEVLVEGKGLIRSKLDCRENGEKRDRPQQARSSGLVVGDRRVWAFKGGIGVNLLR